MGLAGGPVIQYSRVIIIIYLAQSGEVEQNYSMHKLSAKQKYAGRHVAQQGASKSKRH
jgi:hypothetical protein